MREAWVGWGGGEAHLQQTYFSNCAYDRTGLQTLLILIDFHFQMKINTKTSFKRRVFRGPGSVSFPDSVQPNLAMTSAISATNAAASVPVVTATYGAIPNPHAPAVTTPGHTAQIPTTSAAHPLPAIYAAAQNPNALSSHTAAHVTPV